MCELTISISMCNPKDYRNDAYFKATFTLAVTKSSQVFLNSGKENAISVLSNIFLSSEKEVCLYTQNLKPDVADDKFYASVVEDYIKKDGRIYLIVKNEIDPNNAYEFYRLIYNANKSNPDRIKWRVADSEILESISNQFNGRYLNFAVGDERAIRIETDINKFKAICSFNEPTMSKTLANLVKSAFN